MLSMPRGGIRLKMVVMSLPVPIQLLPYGWTKRTFTADPPGVVGYQRGMLIGLPPESKRKGRGGTCLNLPGLYTTMAHSENSGCSKIVRSSHPQQASKE